MKELMNTYNPIDLLFGGMEKLGPGGNVHTLHVLHLLPTQRFPVIVDAGCGTGRQTIVLAQALGTLMHALDTYAPFLHDLTQRAKVAGADAGIIRLREGRQPASVARATAASLGIFRLLVATYFP